MQKPETTTYFAGCRSGKPPRRFPRHDKRCDARKNKKTRQSSKKRVPWIQEEKDAVYKHLGKYIYAGKIPGRSIIDKCLEKEPVLQNRNWLLVKNFCRNKIDSLRNKKRCNLAE